MFKKYDNYLQKDTFFIIFRVFKRLFDELISKNNSSHNQFRKPVSFIIDESMFCAIYSNSNTSLNDSKWTMLDMINIWEGQS